MFGFTISRLAVGFSGEAIRLWRYSVGLVLRAGCGTWWTCWVCWICGWVDWGAGMGTGRGTACNIVGGCANWGCICCTIWLNPSVMCVAVAFWLMVLYCGIGMLWNLRSRLCPMSWGAIWTACDLSSPSFTSSFLIAEVIYWSASSKGFSSIWIINTISSEAWPLRESDLLTFQTGCPDPLCPWWLPSVSATRWCCWCRWVCRPWSPWSGSRRWTKNCTTPLCTWFRWWVCLWSANPPECCDSSRTVRFSSCPNKIFRWCHRSLMVSSGYRVMALPPQSHRCRCWHG